MTRAPRLVHRFPARCLGCTRDQLGRSDGRYLVRFEAIPENVFARIIGVHMIEGHLAYMHDKPELDNK